MSTVGARVHDTDPPRTLLPPSIVVPSSTVTQRWRSLQTALGAFSIVFLVQTLLVKHYGVNVPYWDDWVTIDFYRAYRDGELSIGDLFAQHNEHRLLMTRLAFLGIFQLLGEWHLVAQMLFSALLASTYAAIWCYTLLRSNISPWVALASCLPLISTTQAENMLWGFQIQFYFLVLGTVAGVCMIASSASVGWRTIGLAIAAGFICTFSIASGLLMWGVIGVCLVGKILLDHPLRVALADRKLLLRMAVFGCAAVACGVFYLYDYSAPAQNSIYHTRSLGILAWWMLNALTYPLIEDAGPWHLSAMVGQWLIILGALVLYASRRDDLVSRRKLVLIGGMTLALMVNAAVTGYGRGGSPVAPSRYATLFLWGAVIFVVASGDMACFLGGRRRGITRAAFVGVVALMAGLLMFHAQRSIDGLARMEEDSATRTAAATNIADYLRDPVAAPLEDGPLLAPDAGGIRPFLDDPASASLLPAPIRAQAALLRATTSGTAWEARAFPTTPELLQRPTGWGSWNGSDSNEGELASLPFQVTQPVLSLPVAGYPGRLGNRLLIETADGSGGWLAYNGPEPRERWVEWRVDISQLLGREIRIVAVDASTQYTGWLGVAAPRQLSWSTLLLEELLAHLELVIVGALVSLIVVRCAWSVARANGRLVLAAVTVVCCGIAVYLLGGVLPGAQVPSPAGARPIAGQVNLLGSLPPGYTPGLGLRRNFTGLFTGADTGLEFGPFIAPPGMCFYGRAALDPRTPADPRLDGVEFLAQVWGRDRVLVHQEATALPSAPVDLAMPLPANELVTLRLETRQRANPIYDWAVWEAPRIAPCPEMTER
jgi:hypothetical protein